MIGQKPNKWIVVAISGYLLSRFLADDWLILAIRIIAGLSLLLWAILEFSSGINSWRKSLGILGLIYALILLVNDLGGLS
ncbi:MAG: hypothetical protein WD061_03565 [Candidatus Saccharimonadales bacterium]